MATFEYKKHRKMQEPIVTYKQAVMLKELDFDQKVTHFYDIIDQNLYLCFNQKLDISDFNKEEVSISAPSVSLALEWVRIVKKIPCGVYPYIEEIGQFDVGYNWRYYGKDEDDSAICFESNSLDPFPIYTIAESDLLTKVLTYAKTYPPNRTLG